jgi:hypothetical protein
MVASGIEAASASLGRQVGEHELRERIAEGETLALDEALAVALEALS